MNARRAIFSCLAAALAFGTIPSASGAQGLADGFRNPPASARPWVYWFWLNGNITREGITLDLEAMKRAGVGGVLIMEVDQGAPLGPVPFAGTKWRQLFQWVCHEAHRLGIQVNMNDDAGWNGSGGPWITPDVAMQKVVWSETAVQGPAHVEEALKQPPTVAGYYRDIAIYAFPTPTEFRIPQLPGKTGLVRQDVPASATYPTAPAGATIPRNQIVDLTAKIGSSGKLTWDAPEGAWTILRMGHTCTGAVNAPSPASGRGLECDKLSKEGSEAAFKGLMGKLIADNRPLVGNTLVRTHIDSWENGSQNWTPRFREEFERLRGYDPTPYLPVFSGRVVDSLEVSERFLWDVRQTIGELVLANYAGHMEELAVKNGIRLSIEAYGDCVFDDIAYAGRADEPMTEFWSWPGNFTAGVVTEMASGAHVYGKQILGAEAFTANDGEKWQHHPATIKALGDWAFCMGVNRFVVHRYALQPWKDRRPGMSMGPWGLHYERGQTWWEQSGPWHQYLARCQYLLQQGLPVADVLYLSPEGAPRGYNPPPSMMQSGYKADVCTAEALNTRVRVVKGLLALPNGMTYRLLVLPPGDTMTPRQLRRVKELVDAGATVVASSKPIKSPSLAGYPESDEQVRQLADSLWQSGRLITNRTPEKVLAGRGVPPDFRASRVLEFTHRRIGDTDVYFVANTLKHAVNASCQFRVTGKAPEIWDPVTGHTEPAAAFTESGGATHVDLRLEPSGSIFVMFPPTHRPTDPVVRLTSNGKDLIAPPGVAPRITVTRATWGPAGDPAHTQDRTGQVRRLIESGRTSFVVAELVSEGDPAPNIVKTLVVHYRIGNKPYTASATDPDMISFEMPSDTAPPVLLHRNTAGQLAAEGSKPGAYVAQTRSGRTLRFQIAAPPPRLTLSGRWTLAFPPGWGAPTMVILPRLASWTENANAGVRYFSGTARYLKLVRIPEGYVGAGHRLTLDLGDVQVMARVKLNGRDLGLLWKPPYTVDITGVAQPGDNTLEIAVTNLWPNRMIGDEQLPEDSLRNPDGTLKEWPKWLQQGKPSPTGRFTFTSWRLWHKGDKLLPSGLLGPVRIESSSEVTVGRR